MISHRKSKEVINIAWLATPAFYFLTKKGHKTDIFPVLQKLKHIHCQIYLIKRIMQVQLSAKPTNIWDRKNICHNIFISVEICICIFGSFFFWEFWIKVIYKNTFIGIILQNNLLNLVQTYFGRQNVSATKSHLGSYQCGMNLETEILKRDFIFW